MSITKIFTLFILLISAGAVVSQTALHVDIDKIKEQTKDLTSSNYYPTLLNRFTEADSTLSSKQLHYLYYGKYSQSFYHPYDPVEGQVDMYLSIEQKEFDAALIYGKMAFDLDPLDLKTLFGISLCYHYLNKEEEMNKYLWLYYSLISVIVESGDGGSEETAMVVMSVSDEQEIINSLQKSIKKQKFINGTTDLVYLEKSKHKELNLIKKLYFNIELPLKKVTSE
jgi:hypothetical protein